MSKPDSSNRPWLAVTPGEPAGVGPDLMTELVTQAPAANLVVIGNGQLIAQRARDLAKPLSIKAFDPTAPAEAGPDQLLVWDQPLAAPVSTGEVNPANAGYVLQCLDRAIHGCQSGLFAGMVTGPVHKGVINQAGIVFSGHTEYLAQATNTEQVVMMLATEGLRVALATTHLPIKDVAGALTRKSLTRTLNIVQRELQTKFGLAQPRIAVCGLNPHAGEGGYLGREEIDVISPVLEQLQAQGMNITGPWPADTLFTPDKLVHLDTVVAMYHDQGLPVLKHMGFQRSVNITLGLPIIRTSVDHGTALELAGTGRAQAGGLLAAVQHAVLMARAQ